MSASNARSTFSAARRPCLYLASFGEEFTTGDTPLPPAVSPVVGDTVVLLLLPEGADAIRLVRMEK